MIIEVLRISNNKLLKIVLSIFPDHSLAKIVWSQEPLGEIFVTTI